MAADKPVLKTRLAECAQELWAARHKLALVIGTERPDPNGIQEVWQELQMTVHRLKDLQHEATMEGRAS